MTKKPADMTDAAPTLPKLVRKRRKKGPEVRVVRDKDGTPVALIHSLSDQHAIERVTGKHTAHIVTTMEALNLSKEYNLSVIETGAE